MENSYIWIYCQDGFANGLGGDVTVRIADSSGTYADNCVNDGAISCSGQLVTEGQVLRLSRGRKQM